MPYIPFSKPFIIGKELFYIAQAVIKGRLSGDAYYSRQCEQWLQTYHGCQRALLTHSCTAALEMSAILCDIQAGDEVIMPSFTFVSTANAFVLRGAVPVFVDIRPDTLNLDETQLQTAITPKTKAIVPVHYAGVACEMNDIMQIAQQHQLYVIEDAAQAILSDYQNKKLGAIGHLGCLSFHETKNVISGEGGALLINDKNLVERAEIIREKGTNRSQFFRGEVDKYTWVDIGSSYLPSELVAAFLYAQLEHAEKITNNRSQICKRYYQLLEPLQQLGHVRLPPQIGNGHIFYLITQSLQQRSELIAFLKQRGINAVFHYVPLHNSPAGQRYSRTVGHLPVTHQISDTLLRLPLYYDMQADEITAVIEALFAFYGE